jgi:hypothetical protein
MLRRIREYFRQPRWIEGILFLSILIVAFAPYLFTRHWALVRFKGTGEIGDTIGGITAPMTSLIGSILVYFALRAQIKANAIIQEQFSQQRDDDEERKRMLYLTEQITLVRTELMDFSFTTIQRNIYQPNVIESFPNYTGTEAIDKLLNFLWEEKLNNCSKTMEWSHPKEEEFFNILVMITAFASNLRRANLPLRDHQYLESSLQYQLRSKVKPLLVGYKHQREKFQNICVKCGKQHGIPDRIFTQFARIGVVLNQEI